MTMLTVRDLDPHVKDKLRRRAARHGRSMEAEVREILINGGGGAEAEYLALGTLREMGRGDEYVARTRAFVTSAPADPFAEEALNDLATYLGRKDDDAGAALIFAEMYQKFPRGQRAERAAWKAGWSRRLHSSW